MVWLEAERVASALDRGDCWWLLRLSLSRAGRRIGWGDDRQESAVSVSLGRSPVTTRSEPLLRIVHTISVR